MKAFRGQCAELCGHLAFAHADRGGSGIGDKFNQWVDEQNAVKVAAAAEAASDKAWSKEELMAKGEERFQHQVRRLPPDQRHRSAAGISTAQRFAHRKGPIEGHPHIVLNGKEGTAMQSWSSLNDLEIASIITYERNAWGMTPAMSFSPQT